MAKKRKSDAPRLDEVDRTMYSSFSNAANSLSHLYSQAMQQQKLSFQAGERHSLEKLYNWILRQQENGFRVTSGCIFSYIQGACESPPSPRVPLQHQQQHHPQTSIQQFPNSGLMVSSNVFSSTNATQGLRSGDSDQVAFSMHTSNDISMDMPAGSPSHSSHY